MATTQNMNITLPDEMADEIKARVEAGEYASESEVIREGLRALFAKDHLVEAWLHKQVGPAFDALKANPGRAISIEQVRLRMMQEYQAYQISEQDSSVV